MTRQHKIILEYVAQELHTEIFSTFTEAEQLVVREDAEYRYLSYTFLRQSGIQHGNIKVELHNDFTTGDNRYPKNRQQTLHLRLCKAVETTEAEEAGAKEAEGVTNLSIKNNGKIRNVSISKIRDIHPRVSQRQKKTATTHIVHLSPAK